MSVRILALPFAILLALSANAAEPLPSAAAKGAQPLSVNEARTRINNEVSAMDTNRDGFIDTAERTAAHEKRKAERQQRRAERQQEHFMTMDTDGDGKVSVAEITAARSARLEALDVNKDGTLSPDEFRQGRRGMRGQRKGGMHGHAPMRDDAQR
jgi:Ca2+-binding EF-hand superfamily protein